MITATYRNLKFKPKNDYDDTRLGKRQHRMDVMEWMLEQFENTPKVGKLKVPRRRVFRKSVP